MNLSGKATLQLKSNNQAQAEVCVHSQSTGRDKRLLRVQILGTLQIRREASIKNEVFFGGNKGYFCFCCFQELEDCK